MDPLTIIGLVTIGAGLLSFVAGLPVAMADNPNNRRRSLDR